MTAPYLLRLVLLSLGCFFLLHLALAAAVAALSGRAMRAAEQMAPQAGARLLLLLRLLPAAGAALLVAGLCAPSYLWLEPAGGAEDVGWLCVTAAAAGAWIWGAGLARAARALLRSSRYLRHCRAIADGDAPVVLLAGVWRPRLVVSRGVRKALTAEQLAAAIRHERAHRASRDNLKRLALAAAPWGPGLQRLERNWAKLAEWAADDRAAAGNPRRPLALAAALVRVARLGTATAGPALATSLMADAADLKVRVERLLNPRQARTPRRRWSVAAAIAAAAAIALGARPETLYAVHGWLEGLMR
jgi:Zn-dependent protease with chaperone function